METVVKLDPDVEELLRNEASRQEVDITRVANDMLRTAFKNHGRRFVQKTYSLGAELVDITHALALADEMDDEERIRRMKLAESQARGK